MRRIALAALALGLLLVAAELGLRVARIGAPVWHHPDPSLGWTLRPWAHGREGRQAVEINAFGQRDVQHSVDKREGVYRIAVLGDERSEAIGLRLRETWWHRLPRELDRCGFAAGRKIEMLNFGVGGYSTAQEAIVLEKAVMRFRPDLVLLQFSSAKDVRENSRALAARLDRPFFALDAAGRLQLDESFLDRRDFERRAQFRYELARELADLSRVAQLLNRATLMARAHARAAGAPAALEPPRDARWEEAWRVTEALLERMRSYAARNGARFAVVATPSPVQLERNADYPDLRLGEFGARHGIPVIALALQLRGAVHELYGAQEQWTLAGQDAAAKAVASGLCRAAGLATPQRAQ